MDLIHPIVLASASPRRQELLRDAGIDFEVVVRNINEDYPENLNCEQVALFLANKKAESYNQEIQDGKIVITADTIVCFKNKILGKPQNRHQAIEMLKSLSANTHDVITGVCIRFKDKTDSFYVSTEVTFKQVSNVDIEYYIDKYEPFDKAGAYGIQEWIGLIAVKKINGSFYNVVGLPVCEVVDHLKKFSSIRS